MTLQPVFLAMAAAFVLGANGALAQVVPGGMRIVANVSVATPRALSVARLGRATGTFGHGIAIPLQPVYTSGSARARAYSGAEGRVQLASWSSDSQNRSFAADLGGPAVSMSAPVVSVRLVPLYSDMMSSFINTAGPKQVNPQIGDMTGVWKDITIIVE